MSSPRVCSSFDVLGGLRRAFRYRMCVAFWVVSPISSVEAVQYHSTSSAQCTSLAKMQRRTFSHSIEQLARFAFISSLLHCSWKRCPCLQLRLMTSADQRRLCGPFFATQHRQNFNLILCRVTAPCGLGSPRVVACEMPRGVSAQCHLVFTHVGATCRYPYIARWEISVLSLTAQRLLKCSAGR